MGGEIKAGSFGPGFFTQTKIANWWAGASALSVETFLKEDYK
jgi:hypothetical protein